MSIADISLRKRAALLIMGMSIAIAMAACGSPSSANSSDSSSGHTIQVSETEWSISMSGTTLSNGQGNASVPAGTVTFNIKNDGTVAHQLEIQGNGIDKTSGSIGPGQSTSLTVSLTAGKYEVWCPIPGHKVAGMDGFATAS